MYQESFTPEEWLEIAEYPNDNTILIGGIRHDLDRDSLRRSFR
jgi:hypothetical protein